MKGTQPTIAKVAPEEKIPNSCTVAKITRSDWRRTASRSYKAREPNKHSSAEKLERSNSQHDLGRNRATGEGTETVNDELEELLRRTQELREGGRLDEAILSARRAVTLDEGSANAWWQLALSQLKRDGEAAAVEALEKTTELAPNFSHGWHWLGKSLYKTGKTDSAIQCHLTAIDLEPENEGPRYSLIDIYSARNQDFDNQSKFENLCELDRLNKLRASDIHNLAVLYANKGDHYTAIPYYRRYLANVDSLIAWKNLAISYSTQDISQDLDAIDCCRNALEISPEDETAKARLEKLEEKLLKVRLRAIDALPQRTLIPERHWYQYYVSPFRLLRLEPEKLSSESEIKKIQQARKLLLQEIDLEDGAIDWMPALIIDKSRAIKVIEELKNPELFRYHSIVFRSKVLLEFLEKGEIGLFLHFPEVSVNQLLREIDSDPDFANWLSEIFVKQYDATFAAALSKRSVELIEPLLDGRRFVTKGAEPLCFETALRSDLDLLDKLNAIEKALSEQKPTIEDIQRALRFQNCAEILELLPYAFVDLQSKASGVIRNIAIGIYNTYQDADLSREVLSIAKNFGKRSVTLRDRIEEDFKALEEIILEGKKDELHLRFGDKDLDITAKVVRFGTTEIVPERVVSVRWGTKITSDAGNKKYEFSINIRDQSFVSIDIYWVATSGFEKQTEYFQNCTNAVFSYVVPHVLDWLMESLRQGQRLKIGGLVVSEQGIVLKAAGWFSTSEVFCPWRSISSKIVNGSAQISSTENRKARASLALSDVDNAWILHLIIAGDLMV